MPVRVRSGIAQLRGNPIFETLRDEVLQAFRLIVHLVPGVVEEIMQETLKQTMVAKNLQRAHFARRAQFYAMVFFVLNKRRLLRRKLLQHSGHGSRADTKMVSQGVARDAFLL